MFKKTALTFSLLTVLTGCQSTSSVDDLQSLACFYPDAPSEEAPKWVCGVTPSGLAISAAGYAKKNIAGISVMNDISANDARVNIGRQFETNVQSIIKTATTSSTDTKTEGVSEEVTEYFENVTKSISSTTLNNSKIITKRTSPVGGLYTLVGMEQADFDRTFNKVLAKAEAKDAELWGKFSNKKTAEELAKVLSTLKNK